MNDREVYISQKDPVYEPVKGKPLCEKWPVHTPNSRPLEWPTCTATLPSHGKCINSCGFSLQSETPPLKGCEAAKSVLECALYVCFSVLQALIKMNGRLHTYNFDHLTMSLSSLPDRSY